MAGIYPGYNGSPNLTGNEVFLADVDPTQATALPESIALTSRAVAGSGRGPFKNALIGGDFFTNPWQRGTSFTSIANTLTYTADRWAAIGGASSSITVSRQTVTDVPGVRYAARVQRANLNADTAKIAFGQALLTQDSRRFQGRQLTLSFFATAGAGFSPSGSLLNVTVATGIGTDQVATGMFAGIWTGTTSPQLYIPSPGQINLGLMNGNNPGAISFGQNTGGNPTTSMTNGTVLTPVVGVGITTTRTRYQLTFTVPATATQLGVVFSFTPTGSADANDWFQLDSVQLEEVAPEFPYATPFEILPSDVVARQCRYFYYRLNEKATAAAVQGNGMMDGTNTQRVAIPLPVPMRTAPTVAVSAGTWRFNVAGTLTAVGGGFAAGAAATQTPEMINVVGALTATAGQATQLVSGAATWGGYIEASAEL